MRNRVMTWFALALLVLGGLACNLSSVSVMLPTATPAPPLDDTGSKGQAATVAVIVLTPTPLPPGVIAQADVEEQLVINVYARVSPAVVCITVPSRFGECVGSGFVIDHQGHIVTNHHVATVGSQLLVTLADERTVSAKVIGTDPGSDLAVLQVDVPAEDLVVAELGDSSTLQIGQRAIAIGNPFGLERTITTGIISSLGRTLARDDSAFQIAELIQTDAAINPGNSGGPLLNSEGQVIGVNTAIQSSSGTNSGVGFAVPVAMVKRVVPELIATGRYRHTWLGVSGRTISPEMVEALDLPVETGALIFEAELGGPAQKAGLRGGSRQVTVSGVPMLAGGDVVIAINGQAVRRFDDVVNYLATHTSVGDVVTLTVVRGERQLEIDITLEERPGNR